MNTIFEELEKNRDLEKDAVICGQNKITYSELYKKAI